LGVAVVFWLESSVIPVGLNHIDESYFKVENSPNSIGAFSVYEATPHNGLPKLYFSVDGIKKENSKLGIFDTTALKKAFVKKLYLKTFISSNIDKSINLSETPIVEQNASYPKEQKKTINNSTNLKQIITRFYDNLENVSKETKMKILFPEIDLSDISEIAISNFSYVEDFDGKTQLQVSSARAYSSYKTKGLSLRGNVIVTSADGTRLQCNNLTWDYDNMTFKVNGVAILSRDENVLKFKDTVFDGKLLPVEKYPVNARKIYRKNDNEG
jgi:hypothetical protein